ncbi:hypothetical protein D3C76_1505960 [compost metagenome]
MAEGGLAHAGQVFDQQVPAGQQASHGQAYLRFLAQQYLVHGVQAGIQFGSHSSLPVQCADATGRPGNGIAPGKLYL